MLICVIGGTGTYQERINRSKCFDSDYGWQVGYWDLAGHLVLGISDEQAFEEGSCYYSGREEVDMSGKSIGDVVFGLVVRGIFTGVGAICALNGVLW